MTTRIASVATLLAVVLATAAWCEVPNLTKAELKQAPEIVVVRILKIYERDPLAHGILDSRDRDINYVAELEIIRVEKGEGLKAEDVIYIHYWKHVGDSLNIGSSGHTSPSLMEDQKVRVHLSKDRQGRHEILLPNGVEAVGKTADE